MRQPLLIPIIHEDEPAYQLVEEYEGIPKGLVVDGASIPRLLWCYKPPDGIHRGPALHHDWNYIGKGWGRYTRKDCDQIFHDQLIMAGLGVGDAKIMWAGVRLGGWYIWSQPKRSPIILPVRNAAPVSALSPRLRLAFSEHIYSPSI